MHGYGPEDLESGTPEEFKKPKPPVIPEPKTCGILGTHFQKSDLSPPPPDLPGLLLMRCVSGSQAYGMATETSDVDIRGIFVPTLDYMLGFMKRVEQIERKPETTIYALRKYMALACNANPNILELLFVPDDCLLEAHPLYALLVQNRQLFLSRAACKAYVGYAYAQLARVKTHRKWLLSGPTKKPERIDFKLPPEPLLTREQRGAFYILVAHLLRDHPEMERLWATVIDIIEAEAFPGWEGVVQKRGVPEEALSTVQDLTGVSDNFIAVLQREQAYHRAVDDWSKYQEWKATRNPARAELERKFGADTKHLSHLARLIIMGEEIMTKGTLTVRRPEAKQLIAIRKEGIWLDGTPITFDKFDDIVAWTKAKEEVLFALYHSDACPLPKKPDMLELEKLCIEIVCKANEVPWRNRA
jgi:hypothetical protein